MGGELRVGRESEATLGKLGGDGGRVGNDQGNDEFALVADNHGIEDVRAGLKHVFNGLRGNKFSGGGFEEVLFAVGDEEVVVPVQETDVARAEPAVFGKNRAGSFGVLEVALHDAGALGEDFAVVGNANLNVGDGAARAADAVLGEGGSEDGRGFRQTIALIDGNANSPKKLRQVLEERGTARHDEAEAAARAGTDFGIDQLVGEGPLQFGGEGGRSFAAAPRSDFPGELHGPIEQLALGAGGLCALLHQTRVDFLEEARDSAEQGGFDLDESLRDVLNHRNVGHRAAAENEDVVERALVNVGEREKGNRQIHAGFEDEFTARIGDVGAEIRVRQHDALGLAGGAGGVDDGSELAGKNLGGAHAVGSDFRAAGRGDQSFIAQIFGRKSVAHLGNDDLLNVLQFTADLQEFCELQFATDEESLRARVIQDIGHAVSGLVEVD